MKIEKLIEEGLCIFYSQCNPNYELAFDVCFLNYKFCSEYTKRYSQQTKPTTHTQKVSDVENSMLVDVGMKDKTADKK